MNYARKSADSLWGAPYIDFGTVTEGPNHLPPRSQAFAGMMLRALDDKPEYWDYLYREVRATFDHWLKRNRSQPTLYATLAKMVTRVVRGDLARVVPDRYPLQAMGL